MRRRHGFSWPLNGYQVTLYISFVGLEAIYALSIAPVLIRDTIVTLLCVLHLLSGSAVLTYFIKTSLIDPQGDREHPIDIPTTCMIYCTICKLPSPVGGRHCRVCNKCVREFDHHCPWLNTCIGVKNYLPFIWLLFSSVVWLTVHLMAAIYILVCSYSSASYFSGHGYICSTRCWHALLALQILFCLICDYAIGMLLVLHIVLRKKAITTYTFITMQHELKQLQQMHQAIEHLHDDAPQKDQRTVPCRVFCNREKHRIQPADIDASSAIRRKTESQKISMPSFYPCLAWRIQDLLEKERSRASQLHSVSFARSEMLRGGSPKETSTSIGIMSFTEDAPNIEAELCSLHSCSLCSTPSNRMFD